VYGTYQGCFRDSTTRALPRFAGETSDMTPARCESRCAGYKYAGVQWYGQCFCGNELRYERRPDSECNTPCNGDRSKLCGGAWRNSIFTVSSGGSSSGGSSSGGSTGQVLDPGDVLNPGQYISNSDGKLIYQHDGNLVLYTASGQARWSTGTHNTSPGRVVMQTDGNLVVYDGGGRAVWASHSRGSGVRARIVNVLLWGHYYLTLRLENVSSCGCTNFSSSGRIVVFP
jgi:hypothetical protein